MLSKYQGTITVTYYETKPQRAQREALEMNSENLDKIKSPHWVSLFV